jgi:hypothetical protein
MRKRRRSTKVELLSQLVVEWPDPRKPKPRQSRKLKAKARG